MYMYACMYMLSRFPLLSVFHMDLGSNCSLPATNFQSYTKRALTRSTPSNRAATATVKAKATAADTFPFQESEVTFVLAYIRVHMYVRELCLFASVRE